MSVPTDGLKRAGASKGAEYAPGGTRGQEQEKEIEIDRHITNLSSQSID